MTKLQDHQKHVLDEITTNETGHKTSLCGVNVSMLFHFTSVGHAFCNRQSEGRLVVCPDCLAVIRKVFDSEAGL